MDAKHCRGWSKNRLLVRLGTFHTPPIEEPSGIYPAASYASLTEKETSLFPRKAKVYFKVGFWKFLTSIFRFFLGFIEF
ncbi:hypothetical protein TNIN_128631 [Trichonephila inaurata madagascariensis]|uniref:Uncharacterized protein n=1 Tax=Trichonephila inaurata madagascariensis TaxID=2747483 RepID=A0A8X6Y4M9_9ARAC|nr:hypothetical protein TNIN_128631 [Trichonephila inaurata madagascariensis]